MPDWYDTLHRGDCIAELGKLDAATTPVDLVFADPPYNIGYDYDVYDDRREDNAYLDWTRQWIEACCGVLKPSGSMWIAIGDEYVAEIKTLAEKIGLHLRSWVIWYYTFGVNCSKKFSRSHTHLLYFVRDPRTFTFNDDKVRVPSARKLVYDDRRADPRGRLPDNTWILRPQDAHDGFRPDHDTWYLPRVAGTFKERAGFHGCQMPEQLLGRIILCSSNPGDAVLDPFAGSGSTLLVAKKLGRRYVGYELSEAYARQAEARIAETRAGDVLDGAADPIASAPATPSRKIEEPDEAGVVAAFQAASEGHAAERVLADPVLNAAFLDECTVRGLRGRPVDWNGVLVKLGHAGHLPRATKRTQFNWDQLDPFLHASEMALRKMMDAGYGSIELVLCDPLAAARFDQLARSLAPGFRTLVYRWGAMKLQQSAHERRAACEQLTPRLHNQRPVEPLPFEEGALLFVPQDPGVYVVATEEQQVVYVGETLNLLDRLRRTHAARRALDQWMPYAGRLQMEVYPLAGAELGDRWGLQAAFIGQRRPALNYLELAEDASAQSA
jgi:site-specific DNA-methyltransferase (adenine-specific)